MTYRVAHGGTGLTEREALRGIISDAALDLVAVLVSTPEKVGADAGAPCWLPDTGVITTAARNQIIAAEPDCFCYCATAVTSAAAPYPDQDRGAQR